MRPQIVEGVRSVVVEPQDVNVLKFGFAGGDGLLFPEVRQTILDKCLIFGHNGDIWPDSAEIVIEASDDNIVALYTAFNGLIADSEISGGVNVRSATYAKFAKENEIVSLGIDVITLVFGGERSLVDLVTYITNERRNRK